MNTQKELIKQLAEQTKTNLLRNLEHIPEAERRWKPEQTARSAQEIVEHVAGATQFVTQVLRGERPLSFPSPEELEQLAVRFNNLEEGRQLLNRVYGEFAAALDAFSEEVLQQSFPTLEDEPLPLYRILLNAVCLHGAFHTGQLTYIQRLLGDLEYHF